MYVCVYVFVWVWVPMCSPEGPGTILESILSFHYVGSRNQTRVTRLGNKHLYLLCCAGNIFSEFDNLFTTVTHPFNFFPHTTKRPIRHSNEMLNDWTLVWGRLFYLTSGLFCTLFRPTQLSVSIVYPLFFSPESLIIWLFCLVLLNNLF